MKARVSAFRATALQSTQLHILHTETAWAMVVVVAAASSSLATVIEDVAYREESRIDAMKEILLHCMENSLEKNRSHKQNCLCIVIMRRYLIGIIIIRLQQPTHSISIA